ncbi:MAG: hypothetical protein JKY94_17320 [Rhodobacteraceae bacterium]|nr:hypothetical protein [Paracoccaceae bacterium]
MIDTNALALTLETAAFATSREHYILDRVESLDTVLRLKSRGAPTDHSTRELAVLAVALVAETAKLLVDWGEIGRVDTLDTLREAGRVAAIAVKAHDDEKFNEALIEGK